MNINVDGLQAFVRIAEFGTFHQAAEALSISQSALSHRIHKLEDYLGVRLLDRTTRRTSLTAVGKTFLPRAQRLVEEFEDSLAELKDLATHGTGEVALACLPSIATNLLPELITEYRVQYPDNRIRILDSHVSAGLQAVLREEVEFGISVFSGEEAEVEFEGLFEDPFVLACRRDHPLAKKGKIKWEHMEPHRIVTVGRINASRVQLDLVSKNMRTRRPWTYEIQHSFSTGLGMVAAGLGVMAVPRLALPRQIHGPIVCRPLIDPTLSRTMGLIRRRGRTMSPASSEFLKLIKRRWRNLKCDSRSSDN